jgi:hypothetical protein
MCNPERLARLDVGETVVETRFDLGFTFLREAVRTGQAALCAENLAEAQPNPRIRELFERIRTEAHGQLKAALASAQSDGEVRSSLDIDAVTWALTELGMAGVSAQSGERAGIEPSTFAAKTCPEGYRLNKRNRGVRILGSANSFCRRSQDSALSSSALSGAAGGRAPTPSSPLSATRAAPRPGARDRPRCRR